MKIPIAALALLFVGSGQGHSGEMAGHWTAISKTALSITGDIIFTPSRITFQNGRLLDLQYVGPVAIPDVTGGKGSAELYGVTSAADFELLNGNRLCGTNAPRWITIRSLPKRSAADKDAMALDVYEGVQPPPDAESCASYSFEAGK